MGGGRGQGRVSPPSGWPCGGAGATCQGQEETRGLVPGKGGAGRHITGHYTPPAQALTLQHRPPGPHMLGGGTAPTWRLPPWERRRRITRPWTTWDPRRLPLPFGHNGHCRTEITLQALRQDNCHESSHHHFPCGLLVSATFFSGEGETGFFVRAPSHHLFNCQLPPRNGANCRVV